MQRGSGSFGQSVGVERFSIFYKQSRHAQRQLRTSSGRCFHYISPWANVARNIAGFVRENALGVSC